MELKLRRIEEIKDATIGELSFMDRFLFWTLEDKVREPRASIQEITDLGGEAKWVQSWKVWGQTAIPRGRYQLALSFSQRFGKVLPELLFVPGFQGIRIHSGNKKEDTEGCILLGRKRSGDTILESRPAIEDLFKLIAIDKTRLKEPTWLTIT